MKKKTEQNAAGAPQTGKTAGAGGEEAALFAHSLVRMYTMYAVSYTHLDVYKRQVHFV